jgi:class 3 adenylate cyclase
VQRKTVTVLFCDVVGSTSLGESVDPEALRAVLARYFERMKAIVERHGATVEKFIGDAVMAVFGVPAVHEDDALRALRAAAEMREAFPELGIEGRIGVNTGEVVTGTEERLATGDAVNIAARLEQAAQPGEILIGEATFRLARDAAEVEPVEPIELKGKSAPLAAYRLLGVREGAPAFSRPPRFSDCRSRAGAAAAPAGVRPGGRGSSLSPLHRAGAGRRGEVTARPGSARLAGGRRDRGCRPLPALRRGDHLLAAARGPRKPRTVTRRGAGLVV